MLQSRALPTVHQSHTAVQHLKPSLNCTDLSLLVATIVASISYLAWRGVGVVTLQRVYCAKFNLALNTGLKCRKQKMLRCVVREDLSYEMATDLINDMKQCIEWLDHHFIYTGQH